MIEFNCAMNCCNIILEIYRDNLITVVSGYACLIL